MDPFCNTPFYTWDILSSYFLLEWFLFKAHFLLASFVFLSRHGPLAALVRTTGQILLSIFLFGLFQIGAVFVLNSLNGFSSTHNIERDTNSQAISSSRSGLVETSGLRNKDGKIYWPDSLRDVLKQVLACSLSSL
jgi:hypothetical protein